MSKRYASLDLARAILTIYIVGFWHLMNYVDGFKGYHNLFTEILTIVSLASFTIMSGFLVGLKDIEISSGSLINFYKSRLSRLYPPLFVALTLFVLSGLSDFGVYIKSIFLLSMIIPPPPITIWYVCMIVLFYIMAPYIIFFRKRTLNLIFYCSILFIFMTLININTRIFDMRVLIYFPSFCFGIWLAKNQHVVTSKLIYTSATIGILSAIGLVRFYNIDFSTKEISFLEISIASTPVAFFASVAFIGFFLKLKITNLNYFVYIISYASMFMYLFHRIIFGFIMHFNFITDPLKQLIFMIVVCLPFMIVLSFIGQKIYDAILARVLKKRPS